MKSLKTDRKEFLKLSLGAAALGLVPSTIVTGAAADRKTNIPNRYVEPAKELKVHGEYDVIVVGGGVAGFAAAIASARNGAKALIIERFPFFGGAATASLMTKMNGFRNQVEPDGLQTTKGIGEEFILRLKDIDGLGKPHYQKAKKYSNTKGNLAWSYTFDPEKHKYLALKMVVEQGINILFHTYFADVIMDGRNITGIIFENKSGRQAAFGKVIIDASGDADVAFKAGAPFWEATYEDGKGLQDNLMYRIIGFDPEAYCCGPMTETVMTIWGRPQVTLNATDADKLTAAEIETRLAVYEHLEQKIKENPILEGATIVQTAPLLGIRQTRFIEGLYQITAEDALEGRRFEDSIAMASKPIINYYGYRRQLEHEGYEIPYRCLLPNNVSGLLVAGRCMSSDQPAFESWRSQAPCMSLGEAAGTAAALSVDHGVEPGKLDIKLLQKQLIRQGAEIGQNKS